MSPTKHTPIKLSLAFAYPSQVLANVKAEDLGEVWKVVDAVSVNILDPGAAKLVESARATRSDIEIRTHSYIGGTYAIQGGPGPTAPVESLEGSSFTTLAQARLQGKRDAQAAFGLFASAHEGNGEAGTYRGKVRRRNARTGRPEAWHARPDAPALFDAWLDGWEEESARIIASNDAASGPSGWQPPEIWDLRFGDPSKFYPNPPDVSERWKKARSVRSLMGYSTDDDEGEAKNLAYYNKVLDRAEVLNPGLPINLYVGVGRVASPDLVVGSDEGLQALVQQLRPSLREVSGYVGGGAWTQLVQGNRQFAAIVKLWPELRMLNREAIRCANEEATA